MLKGAKAGKHNTDRPKFPWLPPVTSCSPQELTRRVVSDGMACTRRCPQPLSSLTSRSCCTDGKAKSTQHWQGSTKDGLNSRCPVALQAAFCFWDEKSALQVSSTFHPGDTKPTAPLVPMQRVSAWHAALARRIDLWCTYRQTDPQRPSLKCSTCGI